MADIDKVILNEDNDPAIIYIPKNAVGLRIIAKVLDEKDDSIYEAETTFSLERLNEARIDGAYWEDDNTKYVINEEVNT